MITYKTFHYNTIRYGNVEVSDNGIASVDIFGENCSRVYMGRFACVDYAYMRRPEDTIAGACFPTLNPSDAPTKVYINPGSKIPRETIRNSGYTIVRDKENADYIIIPAPERSYSERYNIIALADGNLILFRTHYRHGYEVEYNYEFDQSQATLAIEKIKEEFTKRGWLNPTISYKPNYGEVCVFFVRNNEEYEDLLTDNAKQGKKYVMDTRVEIIPSTTISVDTLNVWEVCKDEKILEKWIAGSDWREYPVTLAIFLSKYHRWMCAGPQMKMIREAIPFRQAATSNLDYVEITPKDMAMLQEWILSKLGLPKEGGMTTNNNISSEITKFLRHRDVYAPLTIDHTMVIKDALSLAKM